MTTLKNRIALVALILLLGLMIGCSSDGLSGENVSEEGVTSGAIESSIDLEGIYDGMVQITQAEIVIMSSDGESDYYRPEEEEAKGWMSFKEDASYTVSLDGNLMTLNSNIKDSDFIDYPDLEGSYDTAKEEFVSTQPGDPGFKDTLWSLKFYEKDGIVGASGEIVQEHIETGWTNIISIELTKIAAE